MELGLSVLAEIHIFKLKVQRYSSIGAAIAVCMYVSIVPSPCHIICLVCLTNSRATLLQLSHVHGVNMFFNGWIYEYGERSAIGFYVSLTPTLGRNHAGV